MKQNIYFEDKIKKGKKERKKNLKKKILVVELKTVIV
jgi:hypothetical protein